MSNNSNFQFFQKFLCGVPALDPSSRIFSKWQNLVQFVSAFLASPLILIDTFQLLQIDQDRQIFCPKGLPELCLPRKLS